MDAITYRNTKTTTVGSNLHIQYPIGFAYAQNNHFFHLYSRLNDNYWMPDIKIHDIKDSKLSIRDWATQNFGATEIKDVKNKVGEVVQNVWRPGLARHHSSDILTPLGSNVHEQRLIEQSLRILVEKLDELFLFIEPVKKNLGAFSHKSRELLILACTEVENVWQKYVKKKKKKLKKGGEKEVNPTTNDFVQLLELLHLDEYQITIKPYKDIPEIIPFKGWDSAQATKSLKWYEAYNKTKHDRDKSFREATLINCINAIAANIVLYCVRYSPATLVYTENPMLKIVNHLFGVTVINSDPTTFYIPKIILPEGPIFAPISDRNYTVTWKTKKFPMVK